MKPWIGLLISAALSLVCIPASLGQTYPGSCGGADGLPACSPEVGAEHRLEAACASELVQYEDHCYQVGDDGFPSFCGRQGESACAEDVQQHFGIGACRDDLADQEGTCVPEPSEESAEVRPRGLFRNCGAQWQWACARGCNAGLRKHLGKCYRSAYWCGHDRQRVCQPLERSNFGVGRCVSGLTVHVGKCYSRDAQGFPSWCGDNREPSCKLATRVSFGLHDMKCKGGLTQFQGKCYSVDTNGFPDFCGHRGQPKCDLFARQAFGLGLRKCEVALGPVGISGTCLECGKQGQQPCNPRLMGRCDLGLAPRGGACVPCGGAGQPKCGLPTLVVNKLREKLAVDFEQCHGVASELVALGQDVGPEAREFLQDLVTQVKAGEAGDLTAEMFIARIQSSERMQKIEQLSSSCLGTSTVQPRSISRPSDFSMSLGLGGSASAILGWGGSGGLAWNYRRPHEVVGVVDVQVSLGVQVDAGFDLPIGFWFVRPNALRGGYVALQGGVGELVGVGVSLVAAHPAFVPDFDNCDPEITACIDWSSMLQGGDQWQFLGFQVIPFVGVGLPGYVSGALGHTFTIPLGDSPRKLAISEVVFGTGGQPGYVRLKNWGNVRSNIAGGVLRQGSNSWVFPDNDNDGKVLVYHGDEITVYASDPPNVAIDNVSTFSANGEIGDFLSGGDEIALYLPVGIGARNLNWVLSVPDHPWDDFFLPQTIVDYVAWGDQTRCGRRRGFVNPANQAGEVSAVMKNGEYAKKASIWRDDGKMVVCGGGSPYYDNPNEDRLQFRPKQPSECTAPTPRFVGLSAWVVPAWDTPGHFKNWKRWSPKCEP